MNVPGMASVAEWKDYRCDVSGRWRRRRGNALLRVILCSHCPRVMRVSCLGDLINSLINFQFIIHPSCGFERGNSSPVKLCNFGAWKSLRDELNITHASIKLQPNRMSASEPYIMMASKDFIIVIPMMHDVRMLILHKIV
jgi:hypothetical protein